jgi:hypothetical protein
LYLSTEYANQDPVEHEPAAPDLFIFSDYFPWENDNFLDDTLIYQDEHTTIQIEKIEELPRLNLELHPEIVDFPAGSIATDRLIFIEVKVKSDVLGEFKFPVLYAFAENEAFYCKKLAPNNAVISHIIHVRYGGGPFGGSKASGIWLKHVLCKLKTEVFISDDHFAWQSGDKYALEMCSEIPAICDAEFTEFRKVTGILWSNHGDVKWYKVDCSTKENSNLDGKKSKLFIPRLDKMWEAWNNIQPIKNINGLDIKINQKKLDNGKKEGYWEINALGKIWGYGYYNDGISIDWKDFSPIYESNGILIINKMGDISELSDAGYTLFFGKEGVNWIQYYDGFEINGNPFDFNQPISWPSQEDRLIMFAKLDNTENAKYVLREIISSWLTDAGEKSKINLATNGIYFEDPSINFEYSKLIEELIIEWCQKNQNNFKSITLISPLPIYLEISLNQNKIN